MFQYGAVHRRVFHLAIVKYIQRDTIVSIQVREFYFQNMVAHFFDTYFIGLGVGLKLSDSAGSEAA